MKKGLLAVSILLFLASSMAFAFAYDRFSSAGQWIELEGRRAGDARELGFLGLGGGIAGLIASIFVFLRSRRPRQAL